MNATVRNLTIIALAFVTINQALAQKAIFTTNSGMTIGFGLGASYQQSDIANSRGMGFDFTLGRHIFHKENSFLGADWKVRFLFGGNTAFDHRINSDGTYDNIRLDHFNSDFEFGLTLNRLRERTRIVITGFAGAGMTVGSTRTDLYNADGLLYDYSVIDPNQERSEIHDDLQKLSDKNFETSLVKRVAIIPTLGFFIGYQFTPSFTLGIEHKTNFFLSEQNNFWGIDIDNNILSGSKKDRIHYTTLSFRWSLRRGSHSSSESYYYPTIENEPITQQIVDTTSPVINTTPVIRVYPPVVDITVPSGTTYSTTEERIDISARVENIPSGENIHLFLNGNNVGFDYQPGTDQIRSTLVLAEGRNILLITGENQTGTARDNVTIVFNKPVVSAPPVIRFIHPPTPVTVESNTFEISVQTINVYTWDDVTVTINGIKTNNFSLSKEGVVTTNIGLREGENRVEVSGKNESGTATEHTIISYIKPATIQPPVVRILIPDSDPFRTYQPSGEIQAIITDVKGKENISVSLNDVNIPEFNWDIRSSSLTTSIPLKEGSNVITITARNESGQDVKSQVIIKETWSCPQPVLRMIVPAQNDLTTENPSYTFRIFVENITRRDQLQLKLNSNPVTAYNFNANELICNTSLTTGTNTFELLARNNCGSAAVTASVIYKPAVPVIIEEKPCPAPGLQFSVDAINQAGATHELKGSLTNVKDRSGIKMTLNGSRYENFQFVPNNGIVSAMFRLQPGTHIIQVNVSNDCGQASRSDTVVIGEPKPCPQPALRMMAPVQNDLTTDIQSYTFRTRVSNITGRDQLLVKFSSNPVTSFNFEGNELTFNALLNIGSNSFVLEAKNNCGSAAVTASVIYKPAVPVIIEEKPCPAPGLEFSVDAINQAGATHELKGSLTNVKDRSGIKMTLNGSPYENFQFVPNVGMLSARFRFQPGTHIIKVNVSNECGQASRSDTVVIAESKPCLQPVLKMMVPVQNDLTTDIQSYTFKTRVSNITSRDQLLVKFNSNPLPSFNFGGNELTCTALLNTGSNSFVVEAKNNCGSANVTASITYQPAVPVIIEEKPCPTPGIRFSVNAIDQADATHELKGSVTNVKERSGITITMNGTPYEGFQFVPENGMVSARFRLNPGSHVIKVNVSNECGQVSGSETVEIKEEVTCGPRINPGNSAWQFCLVTPSGTFNRENLTNSNFSYSGPASSLFIMPIAGGGAAVVKGQPYNLRPGQYYLFKGNLTVTVSTKNPGSMGQWSVCIESDTAPEYGNGSNRPASPCEENQTETAPKKTGPSQEVKPTQEAKRDSTRTGGKK